MNFYLVFFVALPFVFAVWLKRTDKDWRLFGLIKRFIKIVRFVFEAISYKELICFLTYIIVSVFLLDEAIDTTLVLDNHFDLIKKYLLLISLNSLIYFFIRHSCSNKENNEPQFERIKLLVWLSALLLSICILIFSLMQPIIQTQDVLIFANSLFSVLASIVKCYDSYITLDALLK